MRKNYEDLLVGNKEWAQEMLAQDKDFFEKISKGQKPQYLWIGCSDSRVPANQITKTESGEIFVHRNVANMVFQNDINLLSVLQYSVEVLKVKDVIVCGHYGCGGVQAAISGTNLGIVGNWINPIKMNYEDNFAHFSRLETLEEKTNLLVEFNVLRQVVNLSRTTIIQNAWAQGETPRIHGLVYSLKDGILKDLELNLGPGDQVPRNFHGIVL
jgi:carbonic anhydrase